MNYTIVRDDQQYGPYSLADLQRYVASGEISLSDLARSEGMTESLPVSQIIGTIAVPPALSYGATAPAQTIYYDNPTNLHWGLVLLFSALSRGLFNGVWGLIIAIWVRKYLPKSNSMIYYIAYLVSLALLLVSAFSMGLADTDNMNLYSGLAGLFFLATIVLSLVSRYSLRSSLEEHYNINEPMHLQLSGVMTFFFAEIYFQYHINDIVRRKKLEALTMRPSF